MLNVGTVCKYDVVVCMLYELRIEGHSPIAVELEVHKAFHPNGIVTEPSLPIQLIRRCNLEWKDIKRTSG